MTGAVKKVFAGATKGGEGVSNSILRPGEAMKCLC